MVNLLIHPGPGDLLPVNSIRILHDPHLVFRDVADNPDTQTGTGEGLPINQIRRDSQLQPCFSNFILEEVTEGLNDFLEVDIIRQSTHIMMGLDDSGFSAQTALYHIRIDGSLNKIVHRADFPGFFLKDPDEFFSYDLSLLFRILLPCQFHIETMLGINPDKIKLIRALRAENGLHLISLILSEKSVVNKDTGQLVSYGLGQENSRHGRVHAAGQSTEDFSVPYLFPDGPDGRLHKRVHPPVSPAATDPIDIIVENLLAFFRVKDFRMELDGIELPTGIFRRRHRAVFCPCHCPESWCQLRNIVKVAHPDNSLLRQVCKEGGICLQPGYCLAIFTDGSFLYFATQQVHHQLGPIAKTQHRNSYLEKLLAAGWSPFFVTAVGAARQYNSLRIHLSDLAKVCLIRIDLTIDIAFADPSCHQLIVLSSKVNNDYGLSLQCIVSFNLVSFCMTGFMILISYYSTYFLYFCRSGSLHLMTSLVPSARYSVSLTRAFSLK